MTVRLIGVYVDFTGAASLGGSCICLVEESDNGNVVLRSPCGEEGPVKAVVTAMETFELAEIIDAIYGPPDQRLVS
jgi:hypothetical protein